MPSQNFVFRPLGDDGEFLSHFSEFISIHALGRERLLVLSYGLPSHPLKILFFARWETMESFCLTLLHTSRQMCYYQKLDRRPPKITGRRVSAVHQGGSEPLTSSPRSEFTTLSLISLNEVCGEHEIAPRLIQYLLENFSSRCWPRSPREIVFSPHFWQVKKNSSTKLGP